MWRFVMEAFAYDGMSDEFSLYEESPLESDDEEVEVEEEEEEYTWTLQPQVPDGLEPDAEARCATFEPCRRIHMDNVTEATCSGFSMEGNWLAIGTRNGPIQIYGVGDGRLAFTLDVLKGGLKRWPCTALSIRPSNPGDSSYNVLLSCDLSGQIHYWHMTSGMHLGSWKEQGNSIYTIDFQPTGVKYATSGSDCKVRVYDASNCTLVQTLSEGNGTTTAGHSNRVFAVKWHPEDVHVALSGGWDNTIQIWDLRAGQSVRSIYGPKVYGDAIDIKAAGSLILSGSWSRSKQLQEWDFGSGKLLRDFCFPTSKEQPCRVYAAKYGKGVSEGLISAGGSGSNETCLFSVSTGQMVARLPDDDQATYALSLSADGSLLANTTGKVVSIVDMKEEPLSRSGEPDSQFMIQTSRVKTIKLPRTNEVMKGETKLTAPQMGSRISRHTGTVTSSSKISGKSRAEIHINFILKNEEGRSLCSGRKNPKEWSQDGSSSGLKIIQCNGAPACCKTSSHFKDWKRSNHMRSRHVSHIQKCCQ